MISSHSTQPQRRTFAEPDHSEFLLEKVASGDSDAFAALQVRYQPLMFNIARKWMHDTEAANDLVIEALVRVFRSAHTYKAKSRTATWITRIVINCAIDAKRKDRHLKLIGFEEAFGGDSQLEDLLADPTWDEEFMALFKPFETEAVIQLIGEMDDESKTILLLNYREDATYEEIGEQLSLPLGTVKSRLFRSRAKLRASYQAWSRRTDTFPAARGAALPSRTIER